MYYAPQIELLTDVENKQFVKMEWISRSLNMATMLPFLYN